MLKGSLDVLFDVLFVSVFTKWSAVSSNVLLFRDQIHDRRRVTQIRAKISDFGMSIIYWYNAWQALGRLDALPNNRLQVVHLLVSLTMPQNRSDGARPGIGRHLIPRGPWTP